MERQISGLLQLTVVLSLPRDGHPGFQDLKLLTLLCVLRIGSLYFKSLICFCAKASGRIHWILTGAEIFQGTRITLR